MSSKKMRNFSRHKNTGDLHRWYILYAECLFLPICIENIWYWTPLQAHLMDLMHDGLMLYIRCSWRDFFESFAPLRFFAFLWFVFGDTRIRSLACLHFFRLADAKDSLTRWLWISKFSLSEAFLKFLTFVRKPKKRFCLPRSLRIWLTMQLRGGQM